MKRGTKIIIATGCAALTVVASLGIWQIAVRKQSENYNLTNIDVSALPKPIETPEEDTFVQLSEVDMHYQVYGDKGHPLILVHGNGGSVNSLHEAATYLANDYKVYVIESRCHGQSTDTDVISYDLMAKDIKEFCDALNLEKPYLIGHSDGGINALTVAYTYPDLLGGFISCGANTTPKTLKPYFTFAVRINNISNPGKLNDMMLELPQIDKEKLSKITCPAYIVAGEFDIMWLSDTVFIHDSIPNSEVAIIKGANHSSYISQDGKQAYVLAKDFFDKIAE